MNSAQLPSKLQHEIENLLPNSTPSILRTRWKIFADYSSEDLSWCHWRPNQNSSSFITRNDDAMLPFNWELPVNCPVLITILIAFFTQPPPPESRNGVIRGYYITYKQSNKYYRRKNFTVNGGKARSYVISNLHPFTEYHIEIQAFTRAGVSPVLKNAKAVLTHEDGM